MDWYSNSWQYRIKITVQSSEVDDDLTDFPIYVDLSDLPSDFFTHVDSNGDDIRVTKSDGSTELPIEVVFIDTSSEIGELHFQASDTLSSSSDTDFYIYYGNASASAYAKSDTYGSGNVWNSDYLAVFHLQETANTDADGYKDATNNNNHGTGVDMSASEVQGKLAGNAAAFDGVDDRISSIPKLLTNDTWSITVYAYWQSHNSSTAGDPIFYQGSGSTDLGSELFGIDGSSPFTKTLGGRSGGATYWLSNLNAIPSLDTWYHCAATHNNTAVAVFVDGTAEGTPSCSGGAHSDNNCTLGAWYDFSSSNRYLEGYIDEVRITDNVLSTEWITTEYNNLSSPSTFYTVGGQETAPSTDWYNDDWEYRVKITVGSSNVDSVLTNFPVYVDLSGMASHFHNNVLSDGGDVRVTEYDEVTEVPIDLVEYTGASDIGELHFRGTTISSSSDTIFYLYYGNPGASLYESSSTYGANNVWTKYNCVLHLNEQGTTAVDGYVDSSGNGNHGTGYNMTSDDYVAGKMGNAADFSDSINHRITVAGFSYGSAYTVTSWMTMNSDSGDQAAFANQDTGNEFYGLWRDEASPDRFGIFIYDSGYNVGYGVTTPGLSQYYHVAFSYSSGYAELFVDGTQEGSTLTGTPSNPIEDLHIGSNESSSPNKPLDGALDEFRISNVKLSADWLQSEYRNQNDADSFYTLSPYETAPLTNVGFMTTNTKYWGF